MEDLRHVQWMQNIELSPIILGSPGTQLFRLFCHAQMICLKTVRNSRSTVISTLGGLRCKLDVCLVNSDDELPSWAPVDWLGSPSLCFQGGGGEGVFVCVSVVLWFPDVILLNPFSSGSDVRLLNISSSKITLLGLTM